MVAPTVTGAPAPWLKRYRASLAALETEGVDAKSLRPLAEALCLLDVAGRIREGGEANLQEALDAVLAQAGSAKGAWYVAEPRGGFRLAAAVGVAPARHLAGETAPPVTDLDVVVPVKGRHGSVGLLAIESPPVGQRADVLPFLEAVAAAASLPLEGALLEDDRQRLSRRLSVKVYQLRNLFELSRELTSTFDTESVKSLATATLMGHLMVSRAALYLRGTDGFEIAVARGFRDGAEGPIACEGEGEAFGGETALRVADLPAGPLRDRLTRMRMGLVAPVVMAGQCEALLLAGDRSSGREFSDEDCDFASTLARQAVGALETVRLHQVSLEKERQDHEIEIAREIQQSLFPRSLPRPEGFEIAARSEACFRVGGDYYDAIALSPTRFFVAVADVSGKGTPASLLMASVHAWLRARAGDGASPDRRIGDLNRFLCASTLANKFVTFFCAEVDTRTREVVYVNAGHIPPFVLGSDGEVARLTEGGPALGLLDGAVYDMGRLQLQPGDALIVVTDGATEAFPPNDETEFGDEGVLRSLRRSRGKDVGAIVGACFDDVIAYAGTRGLGDDLTALAIKVSG